MWPAQLRNETRKSPVTKSRTEHSCLVNIYKSVKSDQTNLVSIKFAPFQIYRPSLTPTQSSSLSRQVLERSSPVEVHGVQKKTFKGWVRHLFSICLIVLNNCGGRGVTLTFSRLLQKTFSSEVFPFHSSPQSNEWGRWQSSRLFYGSKRSCPSSSLSKKLCFFINTNVMCPRSHTFLLKTATQL